MTLLETIVWLFIMSILVFFINGLMAEENQLMKEFKYKCVIRSIIPTFFICWPIHLIVDTILSGLPPLRLNYNPFFIALFIALEATTFFTLFTFFIKKRNQSNKQFKKVFRVLIILAWLSTLISLTLSLAKSPVKLLYAGFFFSFSFVLFFAGILILINKILPNEKIQKDLSLTDSQEQELKIFIIISGGLAVCCYILFLLGMIRQIMWLHLISITCLLFVPKSLKKLGLIPQKIPEKVVKNSVTYAALVAFGIWSIQLVIFQCYWKMLEDFLNFPEINQDIRLNFTFCLIIFVVSFYYSLTKKFLPSAAEKSAKEIHELIHGEEIENIKREVILDVQDLVTYFYTEEGVVRAVEGVSFKIFTGEVLGLVGETGCGKSVTALSILQLVLPPGKIEKGKIIFSGEDLLQKTEEEMRTYRGDRITMTFQDPLNSVNPVFKVGDQISEVYLLHQQKELYKEQYEYTDKIKEQKLLIDANKKEIKLLMAKKTVYSADTKAKEKNKLDELRGKQKELDIKLQELERHSSIYSIARVWGEELLKDVGIPDPEQIYDRYPHELSGGMRQRIMIAMGIACSPHLLIADEPTTALDVTIQNQILQLFKNLKKKYNTSILFITHDLGIISKMCDVVAVMYSGVIVEYGSIEELFLSPYHPYTKALIASVPIIGKRQKRLSIIPGMVPNLIYPPSGCRFHPRCAYCFEPCDSIVPISQEIKPNYRVACHLYNPKYKDLAEKIINKVENGN
ncbi:MAG: ABC transporter ATP-binding protein [Promethearchaeota archaeon]